MKKVHSTILGFPRIGAQRELKKALEDFWKDKASEAELLKVARDLRAKHWRMQLDAGIDVLPVNDFSLYDTVLDLSFQLGVIPKRYEHLQSEGRLRRYFAMARGEKGDSSSVIAMEMSKWYDTNYHYIVPEFHAGMKFTDVSKLPEGDVKVLSEIAEAREIVGGNLARIRPVLVGPVTFLTLGKSADGSNPVDLFPALLDAYVALLRRIAHSGVAVVQLDEPALVTDLDETVKALFVTAYEKIAHAVPELSIFLATYFDDLHENVELAAKLPVHTVHVDLVRGSDRAVEELAKAGKNISLGLIDGRNIWKSNLREKSARLNALLAMHQGTPGAWYVSSSCSLLHSPFDAAHETHIDPAIAAWFSFAVQKLREVSLLSLPQDDPAVKKEIDAISKAVESRANSPLVFKSSVRNRTAAVTPDMAQRKSAFAARRKAQQDKLGLPLFPTTTIGSYPQTQEIRKARADFKKGSLSEQDYIRAMKENIKEVVDFQQSVGLDVFVHGEPERNDMVEYFGENFEGFVSTQNGWVQSYGSRCVKPPVIYGDLLRTGPITVEWIRYAQSISKKPMKAMLTGPITILQWSFVRDDQPRKETAMQIALLIRDEVDDLEQAGIGVIQVDEPAIREGVPLRKRDRAEYLRWAVEAFKVATCSVKDETQMHTHMCYSEFNDIMESIAALDADVLSIEASRSRSDLLDSFKSFKYPNEIGPGVYDIHSPRVPSVEEMVDLIENAMKYIPKEQLWVNPDCGLKTRAWEEVKPALLHMVQAAEILRKRYA